MVYKVLRNPVVMASGKECLSWGPAGASKQTGVDIMPVAAKKSVAVLSQEEKQRVLHAISERWNGNLAAYLEALKHERESSKEPETAVPSVAHLVKSCL